MITHHARSKRMQSLLLNRPTTDSYKTLFETIRGCFKIIAIGELLAILKQTNLVHSIPYRHPVCYAYQWFTDTALGQQLFSFN